jgi:hypothetical protein
MKSGDSQKFANRFARVSARKRKIVKPDIIAPLKETWGDRIFSAREVAEMRQAELEGPALHNLQRSINVFPFVALLLRNTPLSAQSPATLALGMQTKATLIGDSKSQVLVPGLDRTAFSIQSVRAI